MPNNERTSAAGNILTKMCMTAVTDARLAYVKPRMSLDRKHCRRDLTNRGARNGMAKSAANITFEPKPLNNGPQWLVVATFPHARQEQVEGFPTEFDARNWITNDSEAWLTKRG